ncbi:uncharacterized protein PHACADRAFT_266453 [Phanerochaete carnosa HHB-10118-sp]|uniref:Methyltransferase domain-containing protein n=1 Tax=Phanerochaete carnosa (strain HHB-10118-sp) TaxID=650164 RepID=K5UFP3_PHACS|nr:uncharacterized protein PHACADRAFT_266453 [Phanerochaete carnosa HHB-10118-sp]EKM48276.1 hypothetical protein PHACADRAFT_266453 [Phanerochaete carnosa HHB-10118-sp]
MASPADTEATSLLDGMRYSTREAKLDESFYDDAETEFVSELTGIKDPVELKKHVLQVQREAYAIYPYPCIRICGFVKTKISRFPAYKDLLQLGKERPGALFLDVGCGVGNDTRKVVLDGFPNNQIIASNLHAELWDVGHKVFKSTPESFPVKFVAGDVFDDAFLARSGPVATPEAADALVAGSEPSIDLSALTSLTPLRGKLSAIYASSLFHLFDEERQSELARRLASLLSPTPGSFIFGAHIGNPEKGLILDYLTANAPAGTRMFCHSPESWKALWEGIFGEGKVETNAVLTTAQRPDTPVGVKTDFMAWSVKRL